MMNNKKKANKEELFIKITHPIEFRRDLLESSRDTIKLLQSTDKINRIRIEKIEETLRLKKQLKELKRLFLYLKSKLPKSDAVIIEDFDYPTKHQEKIETRTNKPFNQLQPRTKDKIKKIEDIDVKKLDEQLSLIEKKINELS